MSEQTVDVVIVGGGVMGCAAAYHLAREGQRVLLLEQFAVAIGRIVADLVVRGATDHNIERFRLGRPALDTSQ